MNSWWRGRIIRAVDVLWGGRVSIFQMSPRLNSVLRLQAKAATQPVPGLFGFGLLNNTRDIPSAQLRMRMPIGTTMADVYQQAPALRSWLRRGYGA
jgi:hypothetical protein